VEEEVGNREERRVGKRSSCPWEEAVDEDNTQTTILEDCRTLLSFHPTFFSLLPVLYH
jgi:hypothetical protein